MLEDNNKIINKKTQKIVVSCKVCKLIFSFFFPSKRSAVVAFATFVANIAVVSTVTRVFFSKFFKSVFHFVLYKMQKKVFFDVFSQI